MRKTTAMILSALMAALTAVGALIRIPMPVASFTLQVFFTALAGCLLGSRWGAVSQILYVLLGLLGLPVFTAGGGLGALFHPTGGFLLGMIAMAWIVGKITERNGFRFQPALLGCLAGLGILYTIGLPWLHIVMNLHSQWSVSQTVVSGMLIFLPADLLKAVLAAVLCARLAPTIVSVKKPPVNKTDRG